MANRLIFLYRVSRATTEGGTGKGRRTVALVDHGQPGRRGFQENPEPRYLREGMSVGVSRQVVEPMPPRKASREWERARTKTDTGGQVEHTEVIERTLVKELGKMVP
jgi:hypothetical protein